MRREEVSWFGRQLIARGRMEGTLYLLSTLVLVAGALVLSSRGQDGLERYQIDQRAGHLAVAPAFMVEAYCREVAASVIQAPRPKECALLAANPASLPVPAPAPAAAMKAFSDHLNARYQALDRILATLPKHSADWRIMSEGYVSNTSGQALNKTLKKRREVVRAELDRAKVQTHIISALARRFDHSALSKAVRIEQENYAQAAARLNWKASGEALLRLARLLDGEGNWTAAYTVKHLLDAGLTAGYARQAEELVRHGWLLWLGWAGWLWLAIQIGRRSVPPLRTLALLLTLAGALAGAEQYWLDVKLPLAVYWAGGVLAGLAAVLHRLAATRNGPWAAPLPRRMSASPWLLTGWLLFVGIGWLLVADLSLHFHPRLRFLIVHHFTGIWGAVLLLGLVPLFASRLFQSLAWLLSRTSIPTRGGRILSVALLFLLPVVAALASNVLKLPQYLTSEVFKSIAVFYAAWFLLMRAPLLSGGGLTADWRGKARALLPAGLALLAIGASLVITRDLGPLLVILLCVLVWAGAFVGLRVISALLVIALSGMFYMANFLPSSLVLEARMRSMLHPFSGARDDLARLLWFQREAPFTGFGLGKVPWCGYTTTQYCVGLPLQTQSDYTFTALIGLGGVGAWLIAAMIALWAVELMRSRWTTSIHPTTLLAGPRALREGLSAWLAVAFGALVAVQLGVTVAGNLAWIPLTGITLPWVSYGNMALLTMTGFFALLANKEMEHA